MTKILLVEDHPNVRDVLGRVMEWIGFAVISAENGKQGVDRAIAETPDLILMDIRMPEMDGWEATQILRSVPETKNIPIIVMTAQSQPDIKSYIDAGCN